MVNTRNQSRQGSAENPEPPQQPEPTNPNPNPAVRQEQSGTVHYYNPRLDTIRTEFRDPPLSPTDTSPWLGSLDEQLRREGDLASAAATRRAAAGERAEALLSTIQKREYTRGRSADREVMFADTAPAPPAPPASVHSRTSSVTEARKRQAELEAAEKLAELQRRELQLEQELIKKRLAATIDRIEEEGSRAGGSVVDGQQKVRTWLENTGRPEERVTSPQRRRAPSPSAPDRTAHSTPRDRSASRSRGIERLAESLETMMRPAPRQVYELPIFSGDIGEWQTFYHAYMQSTTRYKFSNYENVARLRQALRGEAQQCVKHLIATSTRPELIIRILHKNFGRADLLIDRAIEDLRRLPPVGPSATDLNMFAIKIVNIVSTLVDLDKNSYATNPLLIREITERLSPHLRSRWCSYAKANRLSSNELMLMAEFLLDESDQELEYSHARAPTKRFFSDVKNQPRRTEPRNDRAAGASGGGAIRRPQPSRFQTYATDRVEAGCLCCGGTHRTTSCGKLRGMRVNARWVWAKENRVCFKCLNSKHRRELCKSPGCGVDGCPHSHHRMLHETAQSVPPNSAADRRALTPPARAHRPDSTGGPPAVTPPAAARPVNDDNERTQAREFTSNTGTSGKSNVLLKVLPIIIGGPRGETVTFGLLDEGSTISLIDHDLAEQIGAVGPETALCIQGVSDMECTQPSRRVNATVRGCDGGVSHDVIFRTVRDLNLRRQRMDREQVLQYKHLADLSNACYDVAEPKVLIGADQWHLMLPQEMRLGGRNEPAGIYTKIGWAIFGTAPRAIRTNEVTMHCHEPNDELHELIKQHFEVDALGIKLQNNVSPAEQRAERIFRETAKKIPGPRFEVGQLWATDEIEFPATYGMALNRLRGIEKKMDRDTEFATEYSKQINNLIEKGYAHKLNEPMPGNQWYLPHFAVKNINKPDKKIRVVFDCAAKAGGRSLNDFILDGPDLLQSLPGILFRFREGAYAVTSDIKEMFLQVKIRKEDQPSQMFLWRAMDRSGPPQIYTMSSMSFGLCSSPFLAHSVRNLNAEMNRDTYGRAEREIKENMYMDDYVSSMDTEQEAIEIAAEVAASNKEAGFELRAWASNSRKLLQKIPPENRSNTDTPLGNKENKILGMYWNAETDTLGFNTAMLRVPAAVRDTARAPTKREALSAIMSIYDPLGMLSHYTITAKIQMQRVWAAAIDWDEPLPDEEAAAFAEWMHALQYVAGLRIPRHYFPATKEKCTLHVFADASTQAFSAVAYWRTEHPDGVEVSLVAGKSKVSPLKPLSVPRHELQAALIAARLMKTIIDGHRVQPERVYLWTDSKTVLQWVRTDARKYNMYVSHRLAEIAETTTVTMWRWVPTHDNPADTATRADPTRKVNINDRWYTGPTFLKLDPQHWPREPDTPAPEPNELEEKKEKAVCRATTEKQAPLPDIERFSNYDRLIGATARMLLFIDIVKNKCKKQLGIEHILASECLWLQWAQRKDFPEELRQLSRGEPLDHRSRLFKLDPVLGEDGVLRVRGRIDATPAAINKRPPILDGRNPFVRLLLQRAHRRAHHASNERVINDVNQEYWILRLRPTVRAIAHGCRLCALRRAKPNTPPWGNLPLSRIEPYTRPFENCGLDYFGPVTITIGRRHEKRWVALFTCMTTRAIHLELVHTLSTNSAILCLRRMAARRGWPKVMWSDNATCFRSADKELRAAFNEWLPELREYGLQHRMAWRFIPPLSPNMGGAWERLIRSVKNALSVTLKSRAPKEEVLATLLAEAEYSVNARPLTHISVDPRDEEALTPNHFLLGGPANVPLLGRCTDADHRTWRASQALADHFWSRWVREYLPSLAPRGSSAGHGRPIAVDDYVLIVDPNAPRNTWPRGIVTRVFPGPDGGIRSADVRTKGGVLRRPVSKLAILPIHPAVADATAGGGC